MAPRPISPAIGARGDLKLRLPSRRGICVWATILLTGGLPSAGDATESGTPPSPAVVSIPADAGPAMRFAADELARYLGRILNHPHEVRVDPPAQTAPSATIALDPGLPADGYRVDRAGDQIRIVGGNGRGCMYGAYAFLYALGCRWPLPGPQHEYVPTQERITWSAWLRADPAVRRRGMVYCVADPKDTTCLELVDHLAKLGFNYVFFHVGQLDPDIRGQLAEAINRREMGLEWGGHHLPELLPRELFAEHPEYFRMENGQRTGQLNFCPSSDAALDLVAANATKNYLEPLRRDFNHLETLHLWPDDLFEGGWCACPACAKYSASDQSLLVLNRLAERLQLGPTRLAHCAYHATIEPPTQVRAHPGVRLMYAPRERSYREPIGVGHANTWYLRCLKGLVQAAPSEPEVFEYYHDLILFRFLPMPLHPIIGHDVEAYMAHGIDGIASLSFQTYDRLAYGPNTYVLGRCLWRGRYDPADIVDYCQDLYGPAAPDMVAYYDLLFDLCATAMDTNPYDGFIDLRVPPPDQPGRADHERRLSALADTAHLDRIDAALKKSLEVLEQPWHDRVRREALLWPYARSECRTLLAGVQAVPVIQAALRADSPPAQRADAIQRIETILAGIEQGTELLKALPAELAGPFVRPGNGAFEERNRAYPHGLRTWLAELRAH